MKRIISLMLILSIIISLSTPASAKKLTSSQTVANPFTVHDHNRNSRLEKSLAKPAKQKDDGNQKNLSNKARQTAQIEESKQLNNEIKPEWLIKYKETASLDDIYKSLVDIDFRFIGSSENRLVCIVDDNIEAYVDSTDHLISYTEANRKISLTSNSSSFETQSQTDSISTQTTTKASTQSVTVNDSYFDSQWALAAINASDAWSYSTGNPATNGETIYVAVIDSGIDRYHPDLDEADIRAGWDYLLDGDVTWDSTGHGTSVSGIIAAETNNGIGIAGMCWNIAIIPLLIADTYGEGSLSDMAEAIYDAANSGVKVVNISMGSSIDSQVLEDAVQYASEQGCIIVASAGNDGNSTLSYPASYEEVISVGSLSNSVK